MIQDKWTLSLIFFGLAWYALSPPRPTLVKESSPAAPNSVSRFFIRIPVQSTGLKKCPDDLRRIKIIPGIAALFFLKMEKARPVMAPALERVKKGRDVVTAGTPGRQFNPTVVQPTVASR